MVNIFNRVSYRVHEYSGRSIFVAGGAGRPAAARGESRSRGWLVAVGGGAQVRRVADERATERWTSVLAGGAVPEIVHSGKLSRLERNAAKLPPERAELATRPALDARKMSRIYKKLGITSLNELKENLDTGNSQCLWSADGLPCAARA
jgi:hypothetical protein